MTGADEVLPELHTPTTGRGEWRSCFGRAATLDPFDHLASQAASHGQQSPHHLMDPVDDSRAGNVRRLASHHAMDGGQADF